MYALPVQIACLIICFIPSLSGSLLRVSAKVALLIHERCHQNLSQNEITGKLVRSARHELAHIDALIICNPKYYIVILVIIFAKSLVNVRENAGQSIHYSDLKLEKH